MEKQILLNEQQAAVTLGGEQDPLSVKTLQSWRFKGNGPPFVRVGRSVRYLKSDLDAYLESRRVHSTTENARD